MLRGKGLELRSASSSQRECVLTVANKVRLSTRRSVAEAKELPFFLFFGRGRGFYLRSVAPSSPKPSLTPLHVRCCCTSCRFIWRCRAENVNLTFSRYGSRWVKFEAAIYKFDFKFEVKKPRRRISPLDEADLDFTTGATLSVVTE